MLATDIPLQEPDRRYFTADLSLWLRRIKKMGETGQGIYAPIHLSRHCVEAGSARRHMGSYTEDNSVWVEPF